MNPNNCRISPVLLLCLCISALPTHVAPSPTRRSHDCDSGNPADVIFLLDSSNSIWRPDFGRQISFIKEISRMFRIGPAHTQIGVITYADYPQFQFALNYYSSKSDILAAIDSIRQTGGYHTSTPEALKYMRERGFSHSSGGRENVTHVGIVITDGNSDEPVKTAEEAKRVKESGIHLFAVGVGMQLDLQELEAIASFPSKYYTFMVESYSGLENIKELLAIKACTVTDPPTTTSTTVTTTPSTTTISTTSSSPKPPTTTRQSEMEESRDHRMKANEKDIPKIKFATTPATAEFKSDYFWEYDDTSKQWKRSNRKWSDIRQDGHWTVHKDGRRAWIRHDGPEALISSFDTNEPETLISPSSDPDQRGNLTLETSAKNRDLEYEVLPVDPDPSAMKNYVKASHDGHPTDQVHKKRRPENGRKEEVKNATSGKRHQTCKPKTPLDVVFVVDAKTRDKRMNRQLWDAVKNIVDNVDMNNGQMRVQFVRSCSKLGRLKNRSVNKAAFLDAIGEVTTSSKPTSDLIQTMTSKLTTNGKSGRKRVGIYLTNGPSGDLENTLEAIQEAKNVHEVEMFTVGLGKDVNPVELRAIASCEVKKHMFNVKHNSKSKEILKHLAKSLCTVR